MSIYHSQNLPSYTIGPDAYRDIPNVLGMATVAVIGGKTALEKSRKRLDAALDGSSVTPLTYLVYGHQATFENVERLKADENVQKADAIIAVGGGKCTDTVKDLAFELSKPVFALPTIASNCSPVSKISIMYNEDDSFRKIVQLPCPPVHTFIDTQVCAEAPSQFLWAGLGDTPAKYYESKFSMRGDALSYEVTLGKHVAEMCKDEALAVGVQALEANKAGKATPEFERAALNVVVTTGIVSGLVGVDYNSALAHALFYGLTTIPKVEHNHLHGEIVSYGVLVQLVMDGQLDELELLKPFYHKMGLPTKLVDLDLTLEDDFSDALKAAEENQELKHVPYPVTAGMIFAAMRRLEELQQPE